MGRAIFRGRVGAAGDSDSLPGLQAHRQIPDFGTHSSPDSAEFGEAVGFNPHQLNIVTHGNQTFHYC